MKQTIFLDILILLNIYVSFFLFLSTKKLLGVPIARWRMIISCLVSGLFSLIILLDLTFFELTIIKLLMGAVLSFTAFWSGNFKLLLKSAFLFFVVNFIYGGAMLGIWYFISPATMLYKNGVVYFNISSITLVVSTIIAYLGIQALTYILNKRNRTNDIYNVTITFLGREVLVSALHDTGNKVVDIFSGLPVMICELQSLKPLLPEKLYNYFSTQIMLDDKDEDYLIKTKVRLVPISAVNGESCIMAFKPDAISLTVDNAQKACTALVGITQKKLSDGTFHALLSDSMIV